MNMIVVPPGAEQRQCGHEACMEPCTWHADEGLDYDQRDPFGWGTTCDRCNATFVDVLPQEHWESRHAN